MGLVERVSNFLLVLAAITLAVGAFGVVNTMMTSVHERVKDIGIMRSVGASGGQIIKVFMYEAVIIGLIGGIAGYLLGSALAYVTGPLVFEGATVSLVLQYIPLSAGLAVIIAVASSVYPAFRASKIKVAASFRSL
jgi:putative ABC transport system permease protein